MAAGLTISKDEINNVVGSQIRTLFMVLNNLDQVKAVLDGYSSQNLVDTFGFTLADANDLKSALTELKDLAGIFRGLAAVNTLPHDYQVFPRRLLGVGLY